MLQWTWGCIYCELVFLLPLGKCPEVELLDHLIVLFLIFLRNFQNIFHSDCTNLIPTNSVQGFSSLQVLSNTCFLFLITAILTGVRWQVIVVLICISPMVSDTQHIFIYLLAICMSSLGKCLFRSFARIQLLKRVPQEVPLEKELATHYSFLAWRISWTEEPSGLESMGSQRVRHDWATNTPVF